MSHIRVPGPVHFGAVALVAGLCAIAFISERRKDLPPEPALPPLSVPSGFAEATLAVSRALAPRASSSEPPAAVPVPRPAPALSETARASAPSLERHLSAAERAAPLTSDMREAILRIEGIYDPTRIGYFGRALRMEVRAGTATMRNVFGDGWITAFSDPNVHLRVRYLAKAWFWADTRDCSDFWRFRPHEILQLFDQLSDADCRALRAFADHEPGPPVVAASLSLPVFAAPYPGNRLTHEMLLRAQREHVLAVRERLRILRPRPPASADGRGDAPTH